MTVYRPSEKKHLDEALRPLVGGTITAAFGEVDDEMGYEELWPVIIVKTKDGRVLSLVAQQDSEANGPGFLQTFDLTDQQQVGREWPDHTT